MLALPARRRLKTTPATFVAATPVASPSATPSKSAQSKAPTWKLLENPLKNMSRWLGRAWPILASVMLALALSFVVPVLLRPEIVIRMAVRGVSVVPRYISWAMERMGCQIVKEIDSAIDAALGEALQIAGSSSSPALPEETPGGRLGLVALLGALVCGLVGRVA